VRVKKLAKEVVSHVVGDRCIRIKVSKKMTAQSQSALYSLLALKPCMVIWMFWDACIWMVAAVCHAAKLLVSLTVVCFVQYVSGWVSPYTRALLLAIWTISHRVCFYLPTKLLSTIQQTKVISGDHFLCPGVRTRTNRKVILPESNLCHIDIDRHDRL
jgi:uncharacterized membrane protein